MYLLFCILENTELMVLFFFINVWNWGLNTGPHAAVSWKDNASALCMFILNSQEAVQSGLHLTVGGLEFVTL